MRYLEFLYLFRDNGHRAIANNNYSEGGRVLRYCAYACFLILLALPSAFAAQVTLKVQGTNGQILANINARLSALSEKDITDSGRSKSLIEKEILLGLRAVGYYAPTVDFQLQYKRPPAKSVLIANVNLGLPVLLAGTDVKITGQGETDNDYQRLLEQQLPEQWDVLHHGYYETFKAALKNLALRKGYFDAEMTKNELAVSPSLRQGFWHIDFNTGKRYRFGKVTFKSSNIRQDYLANILPFKEGDYYSSDELARLNQRLTSTNWFNSVVISPQFDEKTSNDELPLEVSTTPRSKNSVELGLGYATDIGVRGSISWRKPWLNSRGHSLQLDSSLSEPEQSFEASYRIPLLKEPVEQYYLFQGGVKRVDDRGSDTLSHSYSLNLARHWDLPTGWQRAINLRLSTDDFTQGNDKHKTLLLYPGVSITRIRQQGGAMPTWGDSQRYSIDVSSDAWGSDINFSVFQAKNVWIRTPAEGQRFIFRANFGWIETGHFEQVPPSLRFFAGGDRSIRGYGYNSISPKDSDGKLTGASRLLSGSVEYQYNFTGNWWGALFFDSGEAVNSFKQSDFKSGAGFGIRWESPIGPVKFDIASPVNSSKKAVHFYIGIGAEL